MNKIQVLKPKYRTKEILTEIQECLDTSWTGMGGKAIDFEEKWKDYTDFENAHFLQSATAGLHLALKVFKEKYGWEDGDEIITTPLTFVSTNHAIMYENLKPVFADVDDSLCLDPDSILSNITDKTRAVMFVGIGGNIGQYERVREICNLQNIPLILDAAHLAGTQTMRVYPQYQAMAKSQVGWDADVSVFSFQAVKNLPTADSGMICFKEEKYDKLARQLAWLGIDKDTYSRSDDKGSYKWEYKVPNVGFKYHGNSIMASIGLVQLKYLDEDNDYRNQIATWYDELLENINDIKTIPLSWHIHKSSRHLYQILVNEKKRDEIINHLYKNEIYPGVHYVDNTLYPMYSLYSGTCPRASEYSKQLITLPIHLDITKDDCTKIIETIKEIL